MKPEIHPKLNKECVVTCVCGNQFVTISTLPSIQVEICSNCHPFFTGQQKLVDTEGRVDKFNKRAKRIEDTKISAKSKITKQKTKIDDSKSQKPTTLKELMKQMKDEEVESAESAKQE